MNLIDLRRRLAGFLVVMAGVVLGAVAQGNDGVGRVYLSGCVNKVGAVEIPEGQSLTLLRAIILDGGQTTSADMHRVRIVRQTADGKGEVIVVDLSAAVANGNLAKDVPVLAGDIIVIPPRVENY